MPEIVGVRFRRAGKLQYYHGNGQDLEPNEYVLCDTPRGQELGWVVIAPKQLLAAKLKQPLHPIVRKATGEDLRRRDDLKGRETETLERCRELVAKHRLPMRIAEVEFIFDGKLVVYFTAEDRVDFRALLKDLNALFLSGVDLRQIGARDETKLIGDQGILGRCGRQLCCSSWLTEFSPVSMRMAKEQELPANPFNLAGMCGRLRCCLRYEYEQYLEMHREMPAVGEVVSTELGEARVIVGHPLKGLVSVLVTGPEGEQTVRQLPLAQVRRRPEAVKPARAEEAPAELDDSAEG